jgi:hypothetical protein
MFMTMFLRAAFLRLFALSAFFVANAHAQSEATGDLTLAAPYGIPPDLFNSSIMRTVRQSAVYVPGYNLSAPEGFGPSGNGSAVDGWQLGVAVADNVPLTQAAAPGVNKAQVIDATTLWLQAPAGVEYLNSTVWKLCATVFPYVNMSAVVEGGEDIRRLTARMKDVQNDGSCGVWVTDECATALNEYALAHGLNAQGDCFNMTIPEPCAPYFMRSRGNGTVVGELPVRKLILFASILPSLLSLFTFHFSPSISANSTLLTSGLQSSTKNFSPMADSMHGAARQPPLATCTHSNRLWATSGRFSSHGSNSHPSAASSQPTRTSPAWQHPQMEQAQHKSEVR